MLDKVGLSPSTSIAHSGAVDDVIDVDFLFAAVRRQALLVAACVAVALAICGIYLFFAQPVFTSSAQILIDMQNTAVAEKLATVPAIGDSDNKVASQIQLIQSQRMAERVVDRLKLVTDAAFLQDTGEEPIDASEIPALPVNPTADRPVTPAVSGEESDAEGSDEARQAYLDLRKTAVDKLVDGISAERVEQTFAIEISFSDANPQVAQRIAQGYAETYLVDQLESRYEAHRLASGWMEARIEELRNRSIKSDAAVQAFKAEHNLLSTDGKLLTESQLADVSNQLMSAQAERAKAEAKFRQIDDIRKRGDIDAVVSDAMNSTVITSMRQRYLDASKLRGEIVGRLGENHEQVAKLEKEMADYKKLIFDELGRIGESYRSDLEVAKTKESELTDRLQAFSGSTSSANATQVQLRELEREAQSYRILYENFLQRLQESKQEETFPISDARVITDAYYPGRPSSPKTLLVVALGLLLGGLVGAGAGAFREFRDRYFRTGDNVRSILGLSFIGYIPIFQGSRRRRIVPSDPRHIAKSNAVKDYVVDHPFSAAAETLRAAKLAVDLFVSGSASSSGQRRPITIGIVSVLPREGKSTTALNVAQLLAMDKSATLLIDCDLRNPSLSRNLAPGAKIGLADCATEGLPIGNAVVTDPETGLAFLPAGANRRIHNTAKFFSTSFAGSILPQAANCEYIVLDLPPTGVVVDTKAINACVDAFILVVEWGKTARRIVQSVLAQDPAMAEKCVGVILNRTDMHKIRKYQAYGSSEYYSDRISKYYKAAP